MSSMPIIVRICIFGIWMLGLPTMVGGLLFAGKNALAEKWLGGQFLLWATFQLLCVPCILLEQDFQLVVGGYLGLGILLGVAGVIRMLMTRKRVGVASNTTETAERKMNVFWIVFGLLLLLQLVQAVGLAYGDGDDAYYVAVSAITENADTMYQKLPYTGGSTILDVRHGLAPFPIWIAFLSRISGIRTVSVAQVAVPLVLIPMTYLIFYLFGKKLFAGKEGRIPFFLIFTELFVLFGDYSYYTIENFMIARSRQGKAALGSLVIPMLFLLLYRILDALQENRRIRMCDWILLVATMFTGCLCSTMGAFLLCMLVGVVGVLAAISYKRWKVLIPLVLSCAPCVCYALLYVMN